MKTINLLENGELADETVLNGPILELEENLAAIHFDIIVGSAAQVSTGIATNVITDWVASVTTNSKILFLDATHVPTANITLTDTGLIIRMESKGTSITTTTYTFSSTGGNCDIELNVSDESKITITGTNSNGIINNSFYLGNLDMLGTESHFKPPVLTNTQITALTGEEEGWVLFNSDEKSLQIYNGTWDNIGSPTWSLVPDTDYTTRPTSTSVMTVTSAMAGYIKVGMSLTYTYNGTVYYGMVSNISSSQLTVRGATLSTSYDVTNLKFGKNVTQMVVGVNGTYEDASNTALFTNDNKVPVLWSKADAYVVGINVWSRTVDGSSDGNVGLTIGGTQLVTSPSDGLLMDTASTWKYTGVNISTTHYSIANGDAIEATCTMGTSGDAQDLAIAILIVTP